MKSLSIELPPSNPAPFTFVGWRHDQVSFYVHDEAKNPKVVELFHAYTRDSYYQTDSVTPFMFPQLVPAKILPMRLVRDYSLPMRQEKCLVEEQAEREAMELAAEEFKSQWRRITKTELDWGLSRDLADVRFKIRFEMGAAWYLRNVTIRNIHTPEEAEEFEKLISTQQIHQPLAIKRDEVTEPCSPAVSRDTELLADAHRALSSGLILTVGPLMDKMAPNEKLLFNWLVSPNPKRPGWPLSYRDIGERLNISATQVQRGRASLARKYGQDITRFIAEARAKNEKGLNPDQCDSGWKKKTNNFKSDPDLD